MKKFVFYYINTSLCILSMFACDHMDTKDLTINEKYTEHVIDSINVDNFLAGYSDDNTLTVFEKCSGTYNGARRLVFRAGYAVFIDSLQKKNTNSYHSAKFNTTYILKDSIIIAIQYAKIIHPSSNWQGQTPWTQPYVTTHKRLRK